MIHVKQTPQSIHNNDSRETLFLRLIAHQVADHEYI